MPIDKGREGGERPQDDWERIDTEQTARDKAQRAWDAENDPGEMWEQSARPLPEDYGKDRPATRTASPDQAAEMRELWGQAVVDRLIAAGRLVVDDGDQTGPVPQHDRTSDQNPTIPTDTDSSGQGGPGDTDPPVNRAPVDLNDRSRPDQPEGEPGGAEVNAWDNVEGDKPDRANIGINESRRVHILDGDGLGQGGHVAGTGLPGKTEFPATWDDDKIIRETEDVARNPDYPPILQNHDRWLIRGVRDNVEIEVVVEKDGQVWTGYPLGGEGVIQNDAYGNPEVQQS